MCVGVGECVCVNLSVCGDRSESVSEQKHVENYYLIRLCLCVHLCLDVWVRECGCMNVCIFNFIVVCVYVCLRVLVCMREYRRVFAVVVFADTTDIS